MWNENRPGVINGSFKEVRVRFYRNKKAKNHVSHSALTHQKRLTHIQKVENQCTGKISTHKSLQKRTVSELIYGSEKIADLLTEKRFQTELSFKFVEKKSEKPYSREKFIHYGI